MRQKEIELSELLALAEKHVRTDPKLSRSAVCDVFRLARRLRLRIPLEEKRKLCKKCNTYLQPGVSARVRIRNDMRIITCLNCGNIKRLKYSS